jgi:hypothetical protein
LPSVRASEPAREVLPNVSVPVASLTAQFLPVIVTPPVELPMPTEPVLPAPFAIFVGPALLVELLIPTPVPPKIVVMEVPSEPIVFAAVPPVPKLFVAVPPVPKLFVELPPLPKEFIEDPPLPKVFIVLPPVAMVELPLDASVVNDAGSVWLSSVVVVTSELPSESWLEES